MSGIKRGRDLYLYARAKKDSKVSLNFSGSRYYDKTLFFSESLILSWNQQDVFLKTSEKTIKLKSNKGATKAAVFTNDRGEQVIEAEISATHLDAITTNQIFWIEPELTSEETTAVKVADVHKIFESFYKVEGSLETVNSCLSWLGSRTGENLQVISFYDATKDAEQRFEHSDCKSLRHSLRKIVYLCF